MDVIYVRSAVPAVTRTLFALDEFAPVPFGQMVLTPNKPRCVVVVTSFQFPVLRGKLYLHVEHVAPRTISIRIVAPCGTLSTAVIFDAFVEDDIEFCADL